MCDHYKTGSYIQTLLGYVIDAGVKGIVSYILKLGHFAQQQEYNVLLDALRAESSGDAIEVRGRLEVEKGIVHFRISRQGQQDIALKTVHLSKTFYSYEFTDERFLYLNPRNCSMLSD